MPPASRRHPADPTTAPPRAAAQDRPAAGDWLGTPVSCALFSPCRTWRYRLVRLWPEGQGTVLFVLLNPSTADEVKNDPTVERCARRSMAMGFARFEVCNIFAMRATDPKRMLAHPDPIGPENDRAILEAAAGADRVICGWGQHGAHLGRGRAVLGLLRDAGATPYALKLNGSGHPSHPLYLSYALTPFPIP